MAPEYIGHSALSAFMCVCCVCEPVAAGGGPKG